MPHPGKLVNVRVDGAQTFQTIDGFGVNINARYWEPRLLPAMELLLDDLGATLYRVDIWGKSNWLDEDGSLGREKALSIERQAELYRGEIFQRGWGMIRWLNQHGIRPYLTASGIVSPWMLAPDGKTLADLEGFATMMAGMLDWARNKEDLNFQLFGPLNETDLGAPEGPTLDPAGYVQACEALVDQLDARGLTDIRLVVAEQSGFTPAYVQAFSASSRLKGRIAAFAMHQYADLSPEAFARVTSAAAGTPFARTPFWMTEFGDLEQSGEREWYVAWLMAGRLMQQLQAGFRAGLVWDAFDNYHDHDEYWTIYGLLRTGLRAFTPKKRYHAVKHIFRFVRPGFERIAAESDSPAVNVLAFTDPEQSRAVVMGMNTGPLPARLNVTLDHLSGVEGWVEYYRTSETENCVRVELVPLHGGNWPMTGIDVCAPPASIFTLIV